MDLNLVESLETSQMIIPEVNLGLETKDGILHLNHVAFTDWHYYLDALESANALVCDDMDKLPDISYINEIKEISSDISSLLISLKIFYINTLESMPKKFSNSDPELEEEDHIRDKCQRFAKYRRKTKDPERIQ